MATRLTTSTLLRSTIKGTLIFSLLGPLIAMTLVLVLLGLTRPDDTVADALKLLIFVPIAYILIGVPCAITGTLAGFIRYYRPQKSLVNGLLVALCGGLVGALYLLRNDTSSADFLFLCGGLHALISIPCMLLLYR